MFWTAMQKLRGHLSLLGIIPLLYLGFAFTRRWSTWISGFSLGTFVTTAIYDMTLLASNAVVLIAVALFAWRKGPLFCHGWLIGTATAATVIGSAIVLFPSAPEGAMVVGTVLFSAGFSTMFLLWIELYGRLEPRRMLGAYAASLLLGTLAFLFLKGYEHDLAPWVVLILPLLSAGSLVWCVLQARPNDLPVAGEARPWRSALANPSTTKLFAWIAVFGLAFGMGDAMIGQGSAWASTLGRSSFALVMLLGAVFASRRFTLRIVYRVSLPLMIIGLAITFLHAVPWVSRVFMAAGMEGYQTVSLIVCCGMALQRRESAAFLCGLAFAMETLMIQAGKLVLGSAVAHVAIDATFFGILAILALVVATTFLFKESDLVASYSETALRAVRENEALAARLQAYVSEHGLTEKESDVLLLMAQGKTTKEIADELYLASSTVRVHTSKIYQKAGVHNREELDHAIRTLI